MSHSTMPVVQVQVLDTYAGPDRKRPLVPAMAGDVGHDLYAVENLEIKPGAWALLRTGIRIAMVNGFEAQVRPRSGNALKLGLSVLNTPGTVDPGYRGEIAVIAYNANPVFCMEDMRFFGVQVAEDRRALVNSVKSRAIQITRGQKIAQLVFNKVEHPDIEVVESLDESARGVAGFGSTSES